MHQESWKIKAHLILRDKTRELVYDVVFTNIITFNEAKFHLSSTRSQQLLITIIAYQTGVVLISYPELQIEDCNTTDLTPTNNNKEKEDKSFVQETSLVTSLTRRPLLRSVVISSCQLPLRITLHFSLLVNHNNDSTVKSIKPRQYFLHAVI